LIQAAISLRFVKMSGKWLQVAAQH